MYLATMSIGLLTLPPGSHLCQRSCSHTPIYPIYPPPSPAPARFVPPPPSISRIKTSGRAIGTKSRNADADAGETEDACALHWIGWLRLF